MLDLLLKERQKSSTSQTEQLSYRKNVLTVLGAEENLYRIEWMPHQSILNFQLLGKDELLPDDEQAAQDRWQAYMTGFMGAPETPGLDRTLLRSPYLSKHVKSSLDKLPDQSKAASALQMRFCLRSLRMFFVKGGDDWFVKPVPPPSKQKAAPLKQWSEKFNAFLQKKEVELAAAAAAEAEEAAKAKAAAEEQAKAEAKPEESKPESNGEVKQEPETGSKMDVDEEPSALATTTTSSSAETSSVSALVEPAASAPASEAPSTVPASVPESSAPAS